MSLASEALSAKGTPTHYIDLTGRKITVAEYKRLPKVGLGKNIQSNFRPDNARLIYPDADELPSYSHAKKIADRMTELVTTKPKSAENVQKLKDLMDDYNSYVDIYALARTDKRDRERRAKTYKGIAALNSQAFSAFRVWVPQSGFNKFVGTYVAPVIGVVAVTVATAGIGAAAAGTTLTATAVGSTAGTAAAGTIAKKVGLPGELVSVANGEVPSASELVAGASDKLAAESEKAANKATQAGAEAIINAAKGAPTSQTKVTDLNAPTPTVAMPAAQKAGFGLIIGAMLAVAVFYRK